MRDSTTSRMGLG